MGERRRCDTPTNSNRSSSELAASCKCCRGTESEQKDVLQSQCCENQKLRLRPGVRKLCCQPYFNSQTRTLLADVNHADRQTRPSSPHDSSSVAVSHALSSIHSVSGLFLAASISFTVGWLLEVRQGGDWLLSFASPVCLIASSLFLRRRRI